MGSLKIHYSENTTGVGTLDISTSAERHGLVTVKGQNQNFLNHATKFFDSYCGPSGKGRSMILKSFVSLVEPFEHLRSVLDHVQSDLENSEYVRASVQGILASLAPEYTQPNPLVFDVALKSDGHLYVNTNLDFAAANASYHKRVDPGHSTLSQAFLIAQLLGTRANLEVASGLSSDLSLGPVSSIIGANKLASLIKTHDRNCVVRERFTEMVVSDSRAICQAVNARQRTFADVLKLVQGAQKFKEWLSKQQQSADLCQEYCREVSRVDWADKLPPKTVRWVLINMANFAIGAMASPIGAALGIGLSAADYFLLDRLLKGWRPNQFVEGPLKEFIGIE